MITVLLVEDDQPLANSISRYLSFANYEVLHATNGESAIQISSEAQPDVILMDMNMPGISGFEAIKKIRSTPESAGIPIIATTGDDTEAVRAECLEAGANHFIGKPYRMKTLVSIITELCESQ